MAASDRFRDTYADGLPCFCHQFSQLKTANFWRELTNQVLSAAQTFLADLFRIQLARFIHSFGRRPFLVERSASFRWC
jgi:hypothetical protein